LEIIDTFVRLAQMVGLPKSVGEIYGLLFSCTEALPLDGIVQRLQMSKGSASQGLRFLKSINAVNSVYIAGDRRDHFVAETKLRRLAAGFLRERVQPHLESGRERIERIAALSAEQHSTDREFSERVKKLQTWNSKAHKLLPLIQRMVGG